MSYFKLPLQYEVERAFRISKTDLKIRPIYHSLEIRIKAHILISFVSYAAHKEFERKLKLNDVKVDFSQKFLRKIIEHLIALKVDGKVIPINPSDIQKQILDCILKLNTNYNIHQERNLQDTLLHIFYSFV